MGSRFSFLSLGVLSLSGCVSMVGGEESGEKIVIAQDAQSPQDTSTGVSSIRVKPGANGPVQVVAPSSVSAVAPAAADAPSEAEVRAAVVFCRLQQSALDAVPLEKRRTDVRGEQGNLTLAGGRIDTIADFTGNMKVWVYPRRDPAALMNVTNFKGTAIFCGQAISNMENFHGKMILVDSFIIRLKNSSGNLVAVNSQIPMVENRGFQGGVVSRRGPPFVCPLSSSPSEIDFDLE